MTSKQALQMTRRTLTLAAGAAVMGACSSRESMRQPRPIVIGHRGASADRPEHTLDAYQEAIRQGADFIEPDLVMTKDAILVCRHECEIGETTDVATRAEFAARQTTKTIDGQSFSGWFAEDFTLAELPTLQARERLPQVRPNNIRFDNQEKIPTFAQVAALAAEAGVGIYPELKHPAYLAALGLDPVPTFAAALREGGLGLTPERYFTQCFEIQPLRRLSATSGGAIPCVQLIASEGAPMDGEGLSYADLITDQGLARIAEYAVGIGVHKDLILPRDATGAVEAPTDLVARAQTAGLKVHVWTFRPENYFLPTQHRRGEDPTARGDGRGEIERFLALGVDGVFCDHPADGRAAVTARSRT
jgi:glycerophosphoryl diester phosphodiesterase